MHFTLYSIGSTNHISIAPEVDCYFWRQQAITPQYITTLRSMGRPVELTQASISCQDTLDKQTNTSQDHDWKYIQEQANIIYPFLQGRSLLYPEVTSLLNKRDLEYTDTQLTQILQYLYLHNHATFLPGITLGKVISDRMCNRCFAPYSSIHTMECSTCNEECAFCEQCLLLGRSRSCDLLLQFYQEEERYPVATPPPVLTLTPAQMRVSESVKTFLDSSKTKALVWAVTGAGKTEMLVPSVWKVLAQGGKVIWVTPRKDVVIEIAPRLREFFPTVNAVALYGGSADAWQDGELVISTAHQAWRFYHAFDLVIVDEVDAFPLYGDKSLEKGIERALAPNAKQVYLTATPPSNWKRVMQDASTLFVLPVRYHGMPLPVPQLKREWFLKRKLEKNLPIPTVSQFLQKVIENEGQAFIFVPRTQDVAKVANWLIHNGVDRNCIAGVYSQDPDRKEKVQHFRNGTLSFLVTTTILERGVTVPRCFVLVWGADHPVFDQASLVQIAGRVGRSKEYQQGAVWFLGSERTESQRRAKKEIEWLNKHAEKEGFLKKGAYIP